MRLGVKLMNYKLLEPVCLANYSIIPAKYSIWLYITMFLKEFGYTLRLPVFVNFLMEKDRYFIY